MTKNKADWKLKPHERNALPKTDRDRLTEAIGTIAQLQRKLEASKDAVNVKSATIAQLHNALYKSQDTVSNYRFLRKHGVLVEHEGEFKYLVGDDLDSFIARETDGQSITGRFAQALANSMQPINTGHFYGNP